MQPVIMREGLERSMKHAELLNPADKNETDNSIEVELPDGNRIYLIEKEYTPEESEEFRMKTSEWIIQRSGSRYFMADSDSGEDAEGWYCGYFDPKPETAVFDKGELIGFYICPGDLRYSGSGRESFDIDRWGYPGYDLFDRYPWKRDRHVFLFSDPATYIWKDWSLKKREPGAEYKSYIEF